MVFTSTFPPCELIENTPISHIIIEKCKEHGDRIALVDGSVSEDNKNQYSTLTFSQLASLIIRVGNNLHDEYHLKKNDMIAVMLPNLPLFPVLFHGISYVGGIVTTLNPLYSYEEIQSQLADSGAIMMITSKDFLEKAQKSIENTKVKQLFVLDLKDEIVENVLKVEETLLKESARTEMINTVSFNTKEDVFAVLELLVYAREFV